MSERGSFVTEYIYCHRCLDVARDVLRGDTKYHNAIAVPSALDSGVDMPIIAGRIGHTAPGGELITMEFDLGPQLEARLCHPLRVAVLAENGEGRIFTFDPEEGGT